MSLQRGLRPRPWLAMVAGSSSLACGSISAMIAAALVGLAVAGPLGLLRGSGGQRLADALFGPVLLIVWSHGLEPQPAWNHLPAMFTAIAGSPRVYGLPALALVLGVLGRYLAGRGVASGSETRLGQAARRHSRGGIFLSGVAAGMLLGLFLVCRLA